MGSACSPSASRGVARTVSQCTLQPLFSRLTSVPAYHGWRGGRWARHLFGFPSGTPHAAFLLERGQTPSISARNDCCPSLASILPCLLVIVAPCLPTFSKSLYPFVGRGRLVALISALPLMFLTKVGVALVLSLPTAVCKHGFRLMSILPLNLSLRDRWVDATSSLTVCHVHGLSLAVNSGPHRGLHAGAMICSRVVARHLGLPPSCALCEAPSLHCLSECPAFSDLREQWCRKCAVHLDSVSFWICNPSLFHPPLSTLLSWFMPMSRSSDKSASALLLCNRLSIFSFSLSASSPRWGSSAPDVVGCLPAFSLYCCELLSTCCGRVSSLVFVFSEGCSTPVCGRASSSQLFPSCWELHSTCCGPTALVWPSFCCSFLVRGSTTTFGCLQP